jgi:hypothetical protein
MPAIVKGPGFVSVNDYLLLPRDKEAWLIKPLLPVSGAALIYGQEKGGKSSLAIQLAAALSGGHDEWMGFGIMQHGPVLYLQLDTPRSTFAIRFEKLKQHGYPYENENFLIADRECLDKYPFDILQPTHVAHLHELVHRHQAIAVIVDTLRESHSGDEDSSTNMRNVIVNLVGATHPAALIAISHSRKPHVDVDKNLMADHRGSSYVTGRMDVIMRLTKNRLYYGGRSIEEGDMKLLRQDVDGVLLWEPDPDEIGQHLHNVMMDPELKSMRSKARALAPLIHKSEEAAMSAIRRAVSTLKSKPVKNEAVSPFVLSTSGDKFPQPVAAQAVAEVG